MFKKILLPLFFSATIFAQNPVANFSFQLGDDYSTCVNFSDSSTGNIVTWTFYENNVLMQQSSVSPNYFNYCFSDTGCFNVMLVVQDNFGISDSIIHAVCIHPKSILFMANAFSPNGDGINDVFYFYGYMIDRNGFEMRIYDYWGGLVFSSFDINSGWDGAKQDSGIRVQEGVYLVELIWFDTYHQKHTYRGPVSLLR
ncbi:hypothetical protein BH09BAC5_BH09BAC5_22520 [soil metagenome]